MKRMKIKKFLILSLMLLSVQSVFGQTTSNVVVDNNASNSPLGNPNFVPYWINGNKLGNTPLMFSNNKVGIGATPGAGDFVVNNYTNGFMTIHLGNYLWNSSAKIWNGTTDKVVGFQVTGGANDAANVLQLWSLNWGNPLMISEGGVADAVNYSRKPYLFATNAYYETAANGTQILRGADANAEGVGFRLQSKTSYQNGLAYMQFLKFSSPTAAGGAVTETALMHLSGNGNVGIGTNTPGNKLDIAASNRQLRLTDTDDSKFWQLSASSNALAFRYQEGLADEKLAMWMTSNGDVGVGTSSPTQKLEVWGANSAPGTSGTAADGILRLQPVGSDAMVDFGMVTSGAYAWIQPRNRSNYATNFNLSLNPNGGNVGIGTTTPSYKLQVNTVASGKAGYFQTTGSWQAIDFSSDGGTTKGSLAAAGGNIYLGKSDVGTDPKITVNITNGNVGIGTTSPGAKLHVEGGNVWIGQKTVQYTGPDTYKLNVFGNVRADEIVVNTNGADFVFEEGYKLPSLDEVEKHIKTQKHLPGIASAADMQANGVGISELQTKLLQKVEELTLYVIQLKKENEELKKYIKQ